MAIVRRALLAATLVTTVALIVWAAGFPAVFGYVLFGAGGWRLYWFLAGIVIIPIEAACLLALLFVRFPGDR